MGTLALDGRPAELPSLQAMAAAMARWGPDGRAFWTGGPVGLGHLLRVETPEPAPAMPLERGRFTFAAAGRLDNRRELLDALGAPPETSDPELMTLSWERWGTECPGRLLGDWALAVWDAVERRLFLARDSFGTASLFVYHGDRLLAFASSLPALLAHPQVPRELDPAGLERLGAGGKSDGACCYRGVRRLSPGQAMSIGPGGSRTWRYWSPLEFRPVRPRSEAEYLEEFLDLFRQAVRCRLRSGPRPVGILLSGGLDSTSIAALAAPELPVLRGYTLVPSRAVAAELDPSRLGDETPLVQALSARLGNLEPRFVSTRLSPLEGLGRLLDALGQPERSARSLQWMVDLLERARSEGTGILLDGAAGNLALSYAGDLDALLWDALRSGDLRLALRELRASRLGFLRVAFRMVRRLALHRWFPDLRRRYPEPVRRAFRPPATDPLEHARRHARLPLGHALNQVQSDSHALAPMLAADHGISLRSPAADRRLVEFCAGLPERLFLRDGERRWLIRTAMRGLLPPEILDAPRRGRIAGDLAVRARAEMPRLEDSLRRLAGSAPARDLLNLARMRRCLDRLRSGLTERSLPDADYLYRGLLVGAFLERF